MKKSEAGHHIKISDGSHITLHHETESGREPVHVTVEKIDCDKIWVKGSSGCLDEGDAILLEYRIDDDARYRADGEISGSLPDCTFIACDGSWTRVQDRSFVRVSTHGIEVKVPSKAPQSCPDPTSQFEILDVSAGGLLFETNEPFEIDGEYVYHFELTGQLCYVLPARVVRCKPKPGSKNRFRVAVEFVDLNEEHRKELLQWIYYEQVRRHRKGHRKDEHED